MFMENEETIVSETKLQFGTLFSYYFFIFFINLLNRVTPFLPDKVN